MIYQVVVSPVRVPWRIVARQQPAHGMALAADLCEQGKNFRVLAMAVSPLDALDGRFVLENRLELIDQNRHDKHPEERRL